jgi:hypothetical protein
VTLLRGILFPSALGYALGCTSHRATSCGELSGRAVPATLGPLSETAVFVGKKLGRRPWVGTGVQDDVFTVRAGPSLATTSGSIRLFLLVPRWATDQRPYRVGCVSGRQLVAVSGFPVPDGRGVVALWDAKTLEDSVLLNTSTRVAALFDTNTGDQILLGLPDSVSHASGRGRTADLFQVGSTEELAPSVERDSAGSTVVLRVLSSTSWDALGGPDMLRYRFRFDGEGRLLWFDRVVVAGRWKAEGLKPDSVRIRRD